MSDSEARCIFQIYAEAEAAVWDAEISLGAARRAVALAEARRDVARDASAAAWDEKIAAQRGNKSGLPTV